MNNPTILMEPLVLLDCGASYFLPDTWHIISKVRHTTIVLVDPNADRLEYSSRLPCKTFVIAKPLDAIAQRRILYKSNTDSGSSILPPIGRVQEGAVEVSPYFYPMSLIPITTSTLKAELDKQSIDRIDAIKLDTQGSELDILKGLDIKRLEDVVLIEMEVTLQNPSIYKGAATLKDVLSYLEPFGFELVNIRLSREQKVHDLDLAVPNECDVLLMKNIEYYKLRSISAPYLKRFILLCNLYYLYGRAEQILRSEIVKSRFNRDELSQIEQSQSELRALQKQLLSSGHLSLWHRDAA